MDTIFLITIIFLFYFSIYKFFRNLKNKTPQIRLRVPKHGHRCYAEGLNVSETRVVNCLSHGLNPKEYFIFNNLILPSTGSYSTQIDHVVISRFGIFVIETKENNGWVFANENREHWTVTYRQQRKYPLANPLRQNYGHIQVLKKEMPFIEENFVSIVVFTGQCEFKTPRIPNVIFETELIEIIQSYTKTLISQQRLLMAIGKLSYMCQAVDISSEQHIANIQRITTKNITEHKQLVPTY